MSQDRLRILISAGLLLYLISLVAPAMVVWMDLDVPEKLEEGLESAHQEDGWKQLNDDQQKAMVDWSRNTDSQNSSVKGAGGTSQDVVNGMAIDLSGNVFIIGDFSGTATFGSISITSDTGVYGDPGIFVAKLNSSGQWDWAVKAGGSTWNGNSGYGIALDSNGDAYVTGYFGIATFGSINISSTGGVGNDDIFVAKLSSNGSWDWVVKAGGTSFDQGKAIAVDLSGNAYVTGVFRETATFGSTSITSSGDSDVFVAKLSSNGSWDWAVKAGGASDDAGNGIAVDSSGNVYFTGGFWSAITFGSTSLTSSGGYDIFVAKLSSNGLWSWALRAGGISNDHGQGIAVDSSGSVYITGGVGGTATFGSTTFTDGGGIFVAKLSSNSSWSWALKAKGTSVLDVKGIAVDSSGSVYLTGQFKATATFGGTSLMSRGGYDIFAARLSSSGSWSWATSAGGTDGDVGMSIATHSNGCVYISGSFTSTAVFGSTNLVSNGYSDVFIQSFSAERTTRSAFSSAMKVGGSGFDAGFAIAVKSDGTAYIAGSFTSSVTFGSTSLSSSGGQDIFVAKMDDSGSWAWAAKAGGSNNDFVKAIALDALGSIYVTGTIGHGTATFGTCTGCVIQASFNDIFVANLDGSGAWSWVVKAGGSSGDEGRGIAVYDTSIYITGSFQSTASFGSTSLSSNGNDDIFVAKLSTSGSWQWAVSAGGSEWDYGESVAIDSNGYVYVTGHFRNIVSFGSTDLVSDGGWDIFLARLSSNGYWSWAHQAGAGGGDFAYAITTDSSNYVYITGSFAGTATFGSTNLTSSGGSDIFVAKLSSGGSWVWVAKAGGSSSDRANAITLDTLGSAYVTGNFAGTATFGSTNLTSSSGSSDIFVAMLSSSSGSWNQAIAAGGTSSKSGNGIGIGSNGYARVTGGFEGAATFGLKTLTSSGDDDIFVATIYSDGDGDRVADVDDLFAYEGSQFADQDSDGFGDNTNGFHGDSCPSVYGTSWQDRWGCPDLDSDGQSDLYDAYMQNPTQWNDSDGDGLGDNWDGTLVNRNGSTNGIGEYWPNAYLSDPSPLDYDNDGFDDENLVGIGANGPFDDCQLIYGLSSEDRSGCVDSDGDGWSDEGDSHPGDGTQHNDSDSDGYGDDENGNLPDGCPDAWGNSSKDVWGCPDSDGDGWSDAVDSDDDDPSEWSDTDADGFGDNMDDCPNEVGGMVLSGDVGCPDSDEDGVRDQLDDFPMDGTQWSDGDGDGYGDNASGNNPDAFISDGTQWLDQDGDGYGDNQQGNDPDTFPTDPTQWADSDGDGYGDNPEGIDSDGCPTQPGSSDLGLLGCPDTDRDGWSDDEDECPNQAGMSGPPYTGCLDRDGDGIADLVDEFPDDANESIDSDGDGIGDDSDEHPDDFDNDGVPTSLDWDDEDASESVDSDGDGHGDNADNWPQDSGRWSDIDGDGFTDQIGYETSDDCPTNAGNSTLFQTGCSDMDGDGMPDVLDSDIDGDGITNDNEIDASKGGIIYDPFNYSSKPADLDGDKIPDILDFDIDDDGFPNEFEEERGSDELNPLSTPLNVYGDQNTGFFYIPGEGFSSQYDPDGYEISLSILVRAMTTEFLIPIVMAIVTVFAIRRKKRRYKRVRSRLADLDEPKELDGAEAMIDNMILKHKVTIEHGVLLRNLFERRREELLDNSDIENSTRIGSSNGGGRRDLASKRSDSIASIGEGVKSSASQPSGRPPSRAGTFGLDSDD